MNILAIDTSGPYLSVAIARDDKIIAERNSKRRQAHSDILAPTVGKLLKKARLKAKGIDLYAISIGPGSFTGLRIGVAFIKGMNLFRDRPVVAVPSLDVIASGVWDKTEFVCPVVDAKRQNVYAAIYKRQSPVTSLPPEASAKGGHQSPVQRITKYSVMPIEETLKKLKAVAKKDDKIIFTGDGINVYRQEIIKELDGRAVFTKESDWYPGASLVAKIGYKMYNENKGVVKDLSQLKPMYLYPKDIQCRKG